MNRALPAFILFYGLASAAVAAAPAGPLEYAIEVALADDGMTLKGTETILWRNDTDAPAPFLAFHLYMNAFSGSETVFMRESGGRHRGYGFDPDDPANYGWCRVKRVWVDQVERTPSFATLTQIRHPERTGLYAPDEVEGSRGPDDTLAILDLTSALPRDARVEVKLEFETRLPRVFARTGRHRTFIMAGQWFPKLAVFEGTKGWNAHLFHADSEFFADFALYTVRVDLPQKYIIGATGVPVEEKVADGRKRTTFRAERVHDFAFTAWDQWRVVTDRWKHVDLVLLHPPGNASTAPRQLAALKAAMDGMAELCGMDYPYPRITLMDPPRGAEGAEGMEYPMFITGWTHSPFLPTSVRMVEETIVHEFAHNYFYGLLASNEFEHPWMDEGITSYATAWAMERAGLSPLKWGPFSLSPFDAERMVHGLYEGREGPDRAAWRFASDFGYGILNYYRMAVVLRTLENMLGREANLRLYRLYLERWAYRHPAPGDFRAIVREVGGEAAHDFLVRSIERGETPDFAVRRAGSEELSGRAVLRFDPKRGEVIKRERPKTPKRYRIEVVVENRGDFDLPAGVLCVLENGTERRFAWDGTGPWKAFEFEADSPLARAAIDPDGMYPCDRDPGNNAVVAKPRTGGMLARLASTAALAVQLILGPLTTAL